MNGVAAKPEPLALMTCKAVMHAHLSGAANAVTAALLDHMNWRDFRCDPSIDRIVSLTGYSRSSVQEGVEQLVGAELLFVELHGGKGGRNSYAFNWPKIRMLDAMRQAALHSGRRSPETSGLGRPEIRTQTRVNNPISKPEGRTARKAEPSEGMVSNGLARRGILGKLPVSQHPDRRDEAEQAALRRWDADLREHDHALYEAVMAVINDDQIAAVTDAEIRKHGDGLRYILDHLSELLPGRRLGHG